METAFKMFPRPLKHIPFNPEKNQALVTRMLNKNKITRLTAVRVDLPC